MTYRLLLFFLIAAATTACTPGRKSTVKEQPAPKATTKGKKELSEEDLINLKFLFVNANKEKLIGNLDQAGELFAQCIRIDGGNHASMYELARIYLQQKKINDAVFFARSAHMIDPSNVWYSELLAELLMATGKYQEGEALYGELFRDHPRNVDYAFKYASALLFNGKLQEAIKVYDKVEQEIGLSVELTDEKKRLWLRLGKIDKAAEELEKLISKNSSNLKHYSLLVELYQVNDMPEKAMETIGRMQKVNPESPYVYLALAEYYRSTNQKEKSFQQLQLAFGSNELEHDIKLKIITSYLPLAQTNPEMLQQGIALSKILAETHSNDAISVGIYGDFLTMDDQFEEASVQYANSLNIDNANQIVWQQLLICQSQLNDIDGMLESSAKALELFPEHSIFYLFNGVSLTFKKKHEEAVKVLLAGSKLVVDNEVQEKDFYVRLADNYHTLNNHLESDKYFEKALKIDPMDPLVLNNYSYYLSLRKENLFRAEEMSKLSNELRPGQPSYQDTYGWILFVMGKYEDAKKWLQMAIDSGGNENGTILEHMGDVMFKLGDTNSAVDYWTRAREKGETSELIDKKIRDRKFYE